VHALFDEHLIAIEPGSFNIHVASRLTGAADYAALEGCKLALPAHSSHHPDLAAITRHWDQFKRKWPGK
jgi:hypothetical protein